MPESDIAFLTAHEAFERFHARTVSPVELMQAVIDQAEIWEPSINAFTYRYYEDAMRNARDAEDRYMGKGEPPRPLEGIPVAIKDGGHVMGLPTSAGSLTADEKPQPQTSPINARVLESGAIMHARTATPEFSCAPFTHSRKWGVTRNPWNPSFTPGGSSGGAGAALAAGCTTLATGSDIGGSIRIPASCCGLVGYKPPRGRNPVDVPFNLDAYCHTGPMARSVRDAILLQNVMCGPHVADPTLMHPKLTLPLEYSSVQGMKIAWSMDFGFHEVDPSVRDNTMRSLEIFKDAGAVVEEVSLDFDWQYHHAGIVHLQHLFGTSIGQELQDKPDLMTDYAKEFAREGLKSSAADYFNSLNLTGAMGAAFNAAIAGYDLFVCPTTALPAVDAEYDHSHDALIINDKNVDPFLGWVMTLPFNMMSSHPVLSVPSGFSADGVPTGIQLVGQAYQDASVFRAAIAFENAHDGWFNTSEKQPQLMQQTNAEAARMAV